MEAQKIRIATARIDLTQSPYYSEKHRDWRWNIVFYDPDDFCNLDISNIILIKVGNTEEEANSNQIKERIEEAGIHNGDAIALIMGENERVRAFGQIGHDWWIDVTDNFASKTFNDMNIIIMSLSVV